ncbi:MAG TPA: hypothetical protein VFJ51_13075 [Nitrososphaeraceae archaeon]|nr:hypothetical protein [Nitrososphaeraceae archaeon]
MVKRKMKNKILTIVVGTTMLLINSISIRYTTRLCTSHYQIGYNDGCAGNVVPGPHTSDYKRGYANGQFACSRSGSGGGGNVIQQPPQNNPGPSSSSDWTHSQY